ncbi:hypothetical protein Rsub_11333 [Raphidocelis subcapitata]|uniref:Uncharacterized protein n=1 Tax=Raphidocelis subcapitata TaxID=307507 RepID=A0A2V0PKF6_9CHLO|nr:hypothetical protein Rsub_11333 [Raphidocelis subcapitata]|eukprot:GBF97807.1 hypothetical protein Rsub_11333 [Raphidocelis subcapitata]
MAFAPPNGVQRTPNVIWGAVGMLVGFLLAGLRSSLQAPGGAAAPISLAASASGAAAADPGWPPRVFPGEDNPLFAFYEGYKKGPVIHKWSQYFDVYHRHFSRFRGKEVHFLEVGVQSGGSIELWRHYFGPGLHYYGVDINPYTKPLFEGPNTKIFVGSQEDREFWRRTLAELPPMDIVLDDGGHSMTQQTVTFEEVYEQVKEGGIYMVEDTATSYADGYAGQIWGSFGGGPKKPGTFIELAKDKVDELNGWYHTATKFTQTTTAMAFYDQIVVFEKRDHPKPAFPLQVGSVGMDYAPPKNADGSMDPAVLADLKKRYANP